MDPREPILDLHKGRFVILIVIALIINNGICFGQYEKGEFGFDFGFLERFKSLQLLKSSDGMRQVIVIGDYQGRVMTSTSEGLEGRSYGWINYGLISSEKISNHINAYGGEDRFWLGPEGGQYALFFEKNQPFTFANWQTPKAIDIEPFHLIERDNQYVSLYLHSQLGRKDRISMSFEDTIENIPVLFNCSTHKRSDI